MQPSVVFNVAKEFSRFPGGRRRDHGRHSGEEFRETVAIPLLEKYSRVKFVLTGSAGYSTGFLDEAFGELGALYGYEALAQRIELEAEDDPDAVYIAWQRIKDASKERRK